MDEHDPALASGTDSLLTRWWACLELWLQTGVGAPSAAARLALDRLLDDEGSAEWPEVRRRAAALRRAGDGPTAAAALLDLAVWLQMIQRLRDAEQLAAGGDEKGGEGIRSGMDGGKRV